MSRHTFTFSLFCHWVCSHSAKPPRSPSFHPHSFVSDIRSVLGGCSRFRRCCYLISVLSSHVSVGVGPQELVAVTWTRRLSSVFGSKLTMPRRASLFGYCAMVRTPLRLPTTDVAVPPTFEPRQPPLVSWHFFLLAPQVSVPISADHCLLQKAPECNARPVPSWFSDSGLLLY